MKKQYIPPTLTVVMVKNERGYAASIEGTKRLGFLELLFLLDYDNSSSYHEIESFSDHSDWQDDDSFWN